MHLNIYFKFTILFSQCYPTQIILYLITNIYFNVIYVIYIYICIHRVEIHRVHVIS